VHTLDQVRGIEGHNKPNEKCTTSIASTTTVKYEPLLLPESNVANFRRQAASFMQKPYCLLNAARLQKQLPSKRNQCFFLF
jgi:hypothetical protein